MVTFNSTTSSRAPPSRHTLYTLQAHTSPKLHSYIMTINASVLAVFFQHNCTFSPAKYSPQCTWITRKNFLYAFQTFSVFAFASLLAYSTYLVYLQVFCTECKTKNAFNTSIVLLHIIHYTTVESVDAFACEMMKNGKTEHRKNVIKYDIFRKVPLK